MRKKLPFSVLLVDATKKATKIPNNQYLQAGIFPIIDQGKEWVSGFWNTEDGAYSDVPAIIFGDHTRIVKYIDTPFYIGADGVKVLCPARECDNIKYLYYALVAARIPNLGYSRHYKVLKELSFAVYERNEQDRIVRQLDKLTALMALREKELAYFDDLVKSQFIEMFGDFSLRNMKPDWVKVGAIAEVVGGSTPKTDRSEYWGGNNYWVTPAEIKEDDFIITQTQRSLTEKGVSSCSLRCLPVGTVLLSSRAPIGKVAIAGVEMYCNQGFKNLICGKKLNPVYVYVLLKYNSDYLNSLGRGATFKEISKSIVENIYIPVPTIDRQKEFERFVEQTDKSKVLMEKSQKIVQMLIKLIFQLTKIDIEYCNDRKIYSDML